MVAKRCKYGGRRRGTPNKVTRDLREMISTALVNAGGVKYLERQAHAPAFLALLGKILPRDVNLNANGRLSLTMYLSTCKLPATTATSTLGPASPLTPSCAPSPL
jgi:hypothetical protein